MPTEWRAPGVPRGVRRGYTSFLAGPFRRCMPCMGRHAASVVAGVTGRLNHFGEKVRDGIASRSMSRRTIESCRTPEGASVRVEPSVARTRRRAAHPRVPRSHQVLQRLTAARVVCGWQLDSSDGPRIWPDSSMAPTPGAQRCAEQKVLGARLRGDAEFRGAFPGRGRGFVPAADPRPFGDPVECGTLCNTSRCRSRPKPEPTSAMTADLAGGADRGKPRRSRPSERP